jgi:hypothetical protein
VPAKEAPLERLEETLSKMKVRELLTFKYGAGLLHCRSGTALTPSQCEAVSELHG